MFEREYLCVVCQKMFVVKLFRREEAEVKGLPLIPVRCPTCGSTAVIDPESI